MILNDIQKFILREFFAAHPSKLVFSPADFKEIAEKFGFGWSDCKIFISPENKVKWGKYSIEPFLEFKPEIEQTPEPTQNENIMQPMVATVTALEPKTHFHKSSAIQHMPTELGGSEIPELEPGFIPWGFYKDIKAIIKSGEFFPVFISGISGTGKTILIRQACAELKREYVRVQITSESDESDLIGSWKLVNSEMVWVDGPIVSAAKRGHIVCLDETDRASSRIASLLGILEGGSILIKKTGEIVKPAPGFNIIATGNTKGRGSENGKYTFAIIVDDALLERFYVNYTQTFPSEKVIHRILIAQATKGMGKTLDPDLEKFIGYLAKWVSIIYKTFENGAIEDVISLRRAVQILKIYSMFGNDVKAIKLGISRFDEIEQNAFFDLFTKVSDIVINKTEEEEDQ